MKSSEFVDVCGEMVQFIHAESVHKYVGRNLSGNCLECVHRFQVAWNKFHKIQTYLLEQAYFFRFAAEIIWRGAVSCYAVGLATLPLTEGCLQKLNVAQKRMLRCIIGWVQVHGTNYITVGYAKMEAGCGTCTVWCWPARWFAKTPGFKVGWWYITFCTYCARSTFPLGKFDARICRSWSFAEWWENGCVN